MMGRIKTAMIIIIFTFMIMALSACSKADMSEVKGKEAASDQSTITISEADSLQSEASSTWNRPWPTAAGWTVRRMALRLSSGM